LIGPDLVARNIVIVAETKKSTNFRLRFS